MIWRAAALVLLVALVIVSVPAVRHLRETPPKPDPAVRLTLAPPPGVEFGSAAEEPFDLAIAPSGREFAFAAVAAGHTSLWRRAVDATRAEAIAGTSGAMQPAFAHDGTSIFFFAEGKLRQLTFSTGERRDLADAPAPGGIAVRRDGSVLFSAAPGPIMRLASGKTASATTLRAGERTHAFPAWIDDSEAFVYLAIAGDGRRTIRLRTTEADDELVRTDSHAGVRRRNLIYVRDGVLRAEPIDVEKRRVGSGVTLAFDVGVSPSGRGAFAIDDRLLAWGPPARRSRTLQWFSSGGAPLEPISEPGDYWQVRLSPDERQVAVTMIDPLLRTLDVFTMPASGGSLTRRSLALAADTDPVWAPGGDGLAFRSLQDGQPQIYTEAGALYRSARDEVPSDWNAAGLVFHARSAESGFDIWMLSRGATEAHPLVRSGFNEVDGRISPDGRWIAYASDEPGHFDVYVARLDDPRIRTRVSMAGGSKPQWATSRSIVFARGDELLRAGLIERDSVIEAATPSAFAAIPGLRDYAVSRNRERILAIVQSGSASGVTISVLVGWPSLLGT